MERECYIWCFERGMWWKPYSNGYTFHIKEAGKYSYEEAVEIVKQANSHRSNKDLSEEAIVVL